ncbi:MAG: hypothetical protein JSV92_01790 [archaeon]|nr:MAG: hypothetical protein JSV92_01790 [archaeon]
MNYRWAFMGISTVLLGLHVYFLFQIPYSWAISIIGLVLLYFGYAIKRHDWYADYREIGAQKQ